MVAYVVIGTFVVISVFIGKGPAPLGEKSAIYEDDNECVILTWSW